jgi:RNA polymerase sigma factor (sigma-70 family)
MSRKAENARQIENFLRKYNIYKTNITNCQRQLNYLFPNITAKYDRIGAQSSFTISSTEQAAIDRIESKKALDLYEQIARSQTIIESIDSALEVLEDKERQFVELRYFRCLPFCEIAATMNQSERTIFDIKRRTQEKLLISLINLTSL